MNIIDQVLKIPEIERWPDLAAYIAWTGDPPVRDWSLPLLACEALSGEQSPALKCASAIACLQSSIILVDDLIDQEPGGEYERLGAGRTANYSLALQAAAFRLLSEIGVDKERLGTLVARFSYTSIETARGQDLDSQNFGNEEDYWRVVSAKSTPFYGAALHSGAIVSGANSKEADLFWDFGIVLGEVIQLHDDMVDAFHTPAKPDWDRPQNNLLILYGLTADHPDKLRLEELALEVSSASALREAQSILLKSGAVSYWIHHITERYKNLVRMTRRMQLKKPSIIKELLEDQAKPIREVFKLAEIDIPSEFKLLDL
jgi:geranylgeranyl pyrophosphate synthase